MGCVKLLNGLDLTCRESTRGKYYQQIVLINRADLDEILIQDNLTQHRVGFNLQGSSSGKLFRGNESSSVFSATFSKQEEKGIPLYSHQVELPIVGTEEAIKVLLKQIDVADVFAAIQLKSGLVEIYGFKNGLRCENYTYNAQSETGGTIITLSSKAQEYEPPFMYYAAGQEDTHFNNLFANIGPLLGGDFNDDYSDDFYITQV